MDIDKDRPARFSLTSALLGGAAGVGIAYLLGMLLSPILQHWIASRGVSVVDLFDAMTKSIEMNVGGHALNILGGVIGGHLAARLARAKPLIHGAVSSVPGLIALSVQFFGLFPFPYPVWSVVLSFVTPLPSGWLGGLLWAQRHSSERA